MSLDYRTFQSAGKLSTHIIPGGYSRIDSIKGAGGLASSNNGVVMGQSTGGEPNVLYQFNTIAEAVATLISGPLMEAVRLAFSPGGGVNPQRLYALKVNTAVQSSMSLIDGSTNDMIDIISRDYGVYNNQIRGLMETGTNYGKKVTLSFQSETPEVFDDIRRQSLSIQYTTAACTLTIVNNSGANTLVSSVGGLNLDLSAGYTTIGELATYINNQTGFTCVATAGQEDASPLKLDSISAIDIYTASVTIESTMEAIIDTITAKASRVYAEASNGANNRVIPENISETYFTSGSDGSYTATEWTASLVVAESENIQFISTPDTDAAVHAAIKTHCALMSAVTGRKERQFCLGAPVVTGTVATDIASAVSAAIALNSKFGLYAFNGGKAYNSLGVLTDYPASYGGCMLMGQKCALAINEPLTFKELGFISLDYKLSESQTETLLKNGVAAINYASTGVPHLVRQFNTYQTNDLKYNEFSVVTEMLFASRDLREFLEAKFVGRPGVAITDGVLSGATESRLATYEELGIFIKDPLTGLSFWNVQVSISGDVVYVDYDANITLPINFMFTTSHFHELIASI